MEIKVRNVNHAFVEGLWALKTSGVEQASRNGPVLVLPEPMLTVYTSPTERVLYEPRRDANPVFHLMEAIWMLAGRNDSGVMSAYNANFLSYAEADGSVHGAYGARWRGLWGDQLMQAASMLKKNPDSRRVVVQMWAADRDLGADKKDVPCNTHIYFDLMGGVLNMTVCNRSNDMLWGAYGANVVHFSFMQEWMAAAVGVDVGVYRQFSNNFHLYTDLPMVQDLRTNPPTEVVDPYGHVGFQGWYNVRLVQASYGETAVRFLEDCERFFSVNDPSELDTQFMRTVALPLRQAYLARKNSTGDWRDHGAAECDWTAAFEQWCERREPKVEEKGAAA